MRSARKKTSIRKTERKQANLQPEEAESRSSLGDLQQSVGNQALLGLLSASSEGGGDGRLQLKRKATGLMVQRAAREGAESGTASGAQAETSPAPAKASPSLIVEDEAKEVRPGQMRKGEFLSQLRSAVCSTAEQALAGTMWSSMGCPYIERWLDHYSKQPSEYVERALRKYAPEVASVSSAADYIPLVTRRVRSGIEEWRSTGEVKDLPEEFAAGGMPGATVGGLVGGLLSGVGSAISGAVSGAGKALSRVGSMLFKRRESAEAETEGDPEVIREQLGSGQALDSSVQRRMQSAYGVDFAGVRVHTDARARELAEGMQARAFTIGGDIAFGAEEYQPGTPVGDALIAHELAHVVQQSGGEQSSGPMQKAAGRNDQLEEDADVSAVGAVVSTWTGAKDGLADIGRNAIPRLRSGLRLQRCSKSPRELEIERLGNLQYGFMEQKRKEEADRLKKQAEEDAKKKGLPPPVTEPKVELGDVIKKEQGKHALKGSPTTPWDTADQPAWKKRADAAWKSVVASVKGTELEKIAKGVDFRFEPKEALEGGFYAQQDGHKLVVGMSWVQIAEQDPKNAWENLAHEMAGHFEYGDTYAEEIMDSALSGLSRKDRKRFKGDSQKFFETYEYPETEIYASLWQRRYRVPVTGAARPSGGIHPDANIVNKLNVMKDVLHPEVAQAVLKELKRRVDKNDQILQRDKDFFVAKVKEIFGYDL
jgi:hypothetical protein